MVSGIGCNRIGRTREADSLETRDVRSSERHLQTREWRRCHTAPAMPVSEGEQMAGFASDTHLISEHVKAVGCCLRDQEP